MLLESARQVESLITNDRLARRSCRLFRPDSPAAHSPTILRAILPSACVALHTPSLPQKCFPAPARRAGRSFRVASAVSRLAEPGMTAPCNQANALSDTHVTQRSEHPQPRMPPAV